ncbi:reverse transcriptase [Gossypium australe]|uniref:Reverse transcriptase n=1 Tax=Gossypium australe TaxID=47621 RepID=A0A5B6W971_9ROSI|nr:reverse transcriptase [Gossypium australe]
MVQSLIIARRQAIPNYVMSCFLLPKTFSEEIEAVFSRYWWQKSQSNKGIHWCILEKLCNLKDGRV